MRKLVFGFLAIGVGCAPPSRGAEDESRSIRVLDESAGSMDPSTAKAEASGDVTLEVMPSRDVRLGDKLAFRVSSRKPGFLVLVDVDAQGKLTQIYPNAITLSDPKGIDASANAIAPGRPITVPEVGASNFTFVASPPRGLGMAVAIVSHSPLQIVDLPDVPPALAGSESAAEFLRASAKELKIVKSGDWGHAKDPKWSLATAFYSIR